MKQSLLSIRISSPVFIAKKIKGYVWLKPKAMARVDFAPD
jgi:hypothetical protein